MRGPKAEKLRIKNPYLNRHSTRPEPDDAALTEYFFYERGKGVFGRGWVTLTGSRNQLSSRKRRTQNIACRATRQNRNFRDQGVAEQFHVSKSLPEIAKIKTSLLETPRSRCGPPQSCST